MAFPVVESTATTSRTTAGTSTSVNLPGTVSAGALLLVVFRCATSGSVAFPGDWSVLVDNDTTDGADDISHIAYKTAVGNEDATTISVSHGNGKAVALAYSITGAEVPGTQAPEVSTVVTGTTANADPDTVTPTGGAKDYLFIAVTTSQGESTIPYNAYPTDYSDGQISQGTGAGGAGTTNATAAMAARQLNAASANPGQFTQSANNSWSAWTIAVHPGSGSQTVTAAALTVTPSLPAAEVGPIIRKQQKANNVASANSVAVTLDATPVAGNLLVARCGTGVTGRTWSITESGWNQVYNNQRVAQFWKVAGASESTTVTANIDGAAGALHLVVDEYVGLDGTAPSDTSATNAGFTTDTTASTGTTGTTATADALALAQWHFGGTHGAIVGFTNSFTEDDLAAADDQRLTARRILTSTGTVETTATWSTARSGMAGIGVYKQSGGSVSLTAVTLTATPTFPQASISTTLDAAALSATPTLSQADVAQGLAAATSTITPTLPAATLVSGDFPSIRSAVGSTEDPAATSHTVDMPASVSAGDLLIVQFVIASDATITWDNSTFGTWTVTNSFVSATPGNFRVVVATKTATGSEAGGALTVTTSASRVSASQALAISGWDGTAPEMAQTNFASSASPDPSNLTPTWGSDDNLWLVLIGMHNETTVTTPPSGYAGTQVSSATGAMSAYAWKQATATSDNPGAWSLGSAQGIRSTTLAVRGGAVAGQTVTAAALSATPSLPAAALVQQITATALEATPSLPQAILTTSLSAATLTVTPSVPQAAVQFTAIHAATLVVTPTFPQADAGHFLTAATLTEPPTFPQADVSLDTQTVTAVTLTVSVTQPAATLATALAAQTLTETPAQPQATVTAERTATAVTLEVTPSLPQASISARVSAIPLTVSPTQPAARVDHSITAVTLTASATTPAATVTTENDMAAVTLVVTPTLPQASAQVASLSAQTLTEAPSLPQASISYSLSAVTLTASPTLPQASVNHQILAAALTVTPSLQTATLTTENDLAAVTLVVTPTFPQASAQVGTLHAATLTNTPTLPQAALVVDQLVTAAPVTVTPTQPQATLSQQVSAVPLTASPTLPQATLRGALAAQPLTATPSLPQATLRTDVTANTINVTPVIPAAFVTEPVGAVTLDAAPSIPFATLHHALTGQTLEANPTLPSATMIVGIPGRPARGPTGASGTRPNRALVSASANTISTYGPNDAGVT